MFRFRERRTKGGGHPNKRALAAALCACEVDYRGIVIVKREQQEEDAPADGFEEFGPAIEAHDGSRVSEEKAEDNLEVEWALWATNCDYVHVVVGRRSWHVSVRFGQVLASSLECVAGKVDASSRRQLDDQSCADCHKEESA